MRISKWFDFVALYKTRIQRPSTGVIQIPPLRDAAHRSGRNDNGSPRSFRAKGCSLTHFLLRANDCTAPITISSKGLPYTTCHFERKTAPPPLSFRAQRSGVEKSGLCPRSIIPAVTEIVPVGILIRNQPKLFLTAPSLDLLFPGYAGECIAKRLNIDERIDVVTACKALEKPCFMLPDSLANIACKSDVQSA